MEQSYILAIERIFGEETDRWLIGVYGWDEEEELDCDQDLLFRESISRAVDNFVDEERGEVDSLQSLLRCLHRQCARLELAIEEYTPRTGASDQEMETKDEEAQDRPSDPRPIDA